jgi:ABC-type phosphate/phosphonate transport system substrate-binding protein
MSHISITRWFTAGLLFFLANTVLAQGLIMTAPPREKPEAGAKLYGPLAAHLQQLLGTPVTYRHPGNWLNYQRDMRDDKYDIVFDGPHFAAWRIAHLNSNVAVKLPGTLEFYLLTGADNQSVQTTDDLIGKKICGISPPNLSTLSVLAAFDNPVRQPVILGIKGGMGAVYKRFVSGGCDAMVLRDTFYKKKLNDEQRAKLKIIYRPKPLPNQVITTSSRISAAQRQKIVQSLTNGPGQAAADGVVKRFGGKKTKSFVPGNLAEYTGHNVLLEGVIFGW